MLYTYLLYLTLGWGAFALLYLGLLSKETFFNANRAYLLFSMFAGLLLPLAGWGTHSSPMAGVALPQVTVGLQQTVQQLQSAVINRSGHVLGYIWAIGVAIGLFRMGIGLFRIRQTALLCTHWEGNVGFHAGIDAPFSFFNWIFVPHNLGEAPQEAILRHERAHVAGLHSIDVLLSELLCVVLWWHPLSHWYKRALRNVHEYIADQSASSQFSRKQYGLLLIQQSQSGPVLAFANHFLQSPLKQRLIMLSKQHSAPINGLRYAFVLPLALFMAILFQQNSAFAQTSKSELMTKDVDQVPVFVGGEAALGKFLAENIKYPEAARKAKAQGTVAVRFVVNTTGSVENVEVLKSPHNDISEEAIRVVKLTRWTPAIDEGKTVKCQFVLPIRFKLE